MNKKKSKILSDNLKNLAGVPIGRSIKIEPKHLNQTFNIYNGNSWHNILVENDMINCKFGEFANTRKKHIFKKKKKKKKN